jgi:hypothetical protein
MFMGGISPLIVSMSPETIPFRDGHVPAVRYSLTYEIDHPEKVTKAYISIYARGVGEVQRFEVDVQPRGQIEFLLDASSFDMGPTVRFRAHCAFGTTDWFTMGGESQVFPQPPSSQEIGNVTPAFVEPATGLQHDGAGVPIRIWSAQLTRECTPEAQVDGTTVELHNVVALERQIQALLSYSDLQGRPVVLRHFEVQLVVNGPGMPAADVYNLNFVEE